MLLLLKMAEGGFCALMHILQSCDDDELHMVRLSQPLTFRFSEVLPFVAAGHIWEVRAKDCHLCALLNRILPRTECVLILLPRRLVCQLSITDLL
jgi:hypothetical protein